MPRRVSPKIRHSSPRAWLSFSRLLGPGELVVFRGDQRHSYKNAGSEPAIAYSVVAFSPV